MLDHRIVNAQAAKPKNEKQQSLSSGIYSTFPLYYLNRSKKTSREKYLNLIFSCSLYK